MATRKTKAPKEIGKAKTNNKSLEGSNPDDPQASSQSEELWDRFREMISVVMSVPKEEVQFLIEEEKQLQKEHRLRKKKDK